MMSQFTKQEENGNNFWGETLGSAVLDSSASGTICRTKYLNVFLKHYLTHKEKKIVKEGVRTFKFSNGNKLNYKVTLSYVIADIEVCIIIDVVDTDIPLLLSKDSMKRGGTCLNFENYSMMMFKKKILLRCTSSGHYHIPI